MGTTEYSTHTESKSFGMHPLCIEKVNDLDSQHFHFRCIPPLMFLTSRLFGGLI